MKSQQKTRLKNMQIKAGIRAGTCEDELRDCYAALRHTRNKCYPCLIKEAPAPSRKQPLLLTKIK